MGNDITDLFGNKIDLRVVCVFIEIFSASKFGIKRNIFRCVDWAITHSLKRVTHADVDAFI